MPDLLRSLHVGDLAIRAQTIALQTTGHNIANANTEGYTRQRVLFRTSLPQDLVFAQLGRGVRPERIERVINESLEAALQDSKSALGSLQVQADSLRQAEAILTQFTENELDTSLSKFFDALQDLSANPEERAIRQLVLTEGATLADSIRTIASRFDDLRDQLDEDVKLNVDRINTLTTEIALTNTDIVRLENGGLQNRTANDLRDRRDQLVRELSQLLDIRTFEEPQGHLNVLAGNSFLVYRQISERLVTESRPDRNISVQDVKFESGTFVTLGGGELAGAIKIRDEVLPRFIDDLDVFTRTFTDAFNQIHSEGRGLERFTTVTSRVAINEKNEATIPLVVNDAVTSGGKKNLLFATGLTTTFPTDSLNGLKLVGTSGANAGLERTILDYDGVTGQITFDEPFTEFWATGDTFAITSLDFPPEDGSFDLVITDELSGAVKTFSIDVDLDGIFPDDTLSDVVTDISTKLTAFYGAGSEPLTATIRPDNRLELVTTSPSFTFSFAEDTSNLLAAIGINTFFAGRDARNLSIDPALEGKPLFVAAGKSNAPGDNKNVLDMLALRESLMFNNGTTTPESFIRGVIADLAIQTREAGDLLINQERLDLNLVNQREAISGVNLDEEAINLVTHQRAFQAAARYLGVINDMFDVLFSI